MQKEQLIAKFQELYGEGGEIRTYFAPGRVNLIGEHTDYNGGHVFPCALTMGTWAVVRNRADRKLGFYSLNFEKLGIIETSLDELVPNKDAGWTNYPKGVMWAFEKRGYELTHGMDILIYGNIPLVFIYCMFCTFLSDRIFDRILVLFESVLCKISKCLYICNLLKFL